jgi:hypothetical protein
MKGREHLADLGVNGRILLKLILNMFCRYEMDMVQWQETLMLVLNLLLAHVTTINLLIS